jgi:colanic acid/amylovoran biosynthesis protein
MSAQLQMPRILLSGTFCALNKGDAAMELSLQRALIDLVPEAKITIATPFPDTDAATYPGIRLVRTYRRNPVVAFTLLGACLLWRVTKRVTGLDLTWLHSVRELRAVREADIVIDLSGDTLTEDYGLPCLLSHLMPIAYGLLLGRPVVLCAQTIGPFPRICSLVAFVLNRVDLITTREDRSYQFLEQIGVDRPSVQLTGDMAFLLEPASHERVREICAAEGIAPGEGPLIGLAPSRLPGLRQAVHRPEHMHRLIAEFVDRVIEKLGVKVVLIAHVTGPGRQRDDRETARAIRLAAVHGDSIGIVEGDYRPEELKGLIACMDLFVGFRMHANIAALASGVPTLAIAYSGKTRGIMDQHGQGQWVCDVHQLSATALADRVAALWRVRDRVREELQGSAGKMQARALENATLIVEQLRAN